MYLWVMIATLLAAMAAYILPVRNDMQKVVDEPVAETVVAKFLAQHIAGENFMTAHSTPYVGACSTEPEGDECKQQKRDRYVDYIPTDWGTILDENEGEDRTTYLPTGFLSDDSYKSRIMCFETENMGPIEECYDPEIKIVRYLLTIGPIPQQWLYKVGDEWRPTSDIQEVLRKKFTKNTPVGILRVNDNKYYIHNFNDDDDNDFEIPNEFMESNPCEATCCFAYLTRK